MATLAEIMTRDVFVSEPGAPVSDAATGMLRGGFGSAVVMEGSMILGILTERDVLRSAASGADPKSARVSEWMTPDPVTAGPGMDGEGAIELMMSHGFRHLPVLDGGELVGVVSLRDVVRMQIGRKG